MPVIYDTTPIIRVSKDTAIAKYLDLTKFLSLLIKESLFFCRLDKLEDQFEGATAKKNYDFRISYHKQLRDDNFFDTLPTDEEIIKTLKLCMNLRERSKH